MSFNSFKFYYDDNFCVKVLKYNDNAVVFLPHTPYNSIKKLKSSNDKQIASL